MKGNELTEWRKGWRLTQGELARLLGVALMTVNRWERGSRGIPVLLPLALEALENRFKQAGRDPGQK